MTEAELPEDTARSLRRMLDILDDDPPQSRLRLGGGTALAAVWNHRTSTDVDLDCRMPAFRAAFPARRRRRIIEELRRRREAGEDIEGVAAGWRMIGWKAKSGPVSIVPGKPMPDMPEFWNDIVVKNTQVRLSSVEAILYGKLFGRLLGANNPLLRDGYDFAAALLLDNEKARKAVSMDWAEEGQMENAVKAAIHTKRGRPLRDPAFPQIAENPWREALRIMENGLTLQDYEDHRRAHGGEKPMGSTE